MKILKRSRDTRGMIECLASGPMSLNLLSESSAAATLEVIGSVPAHRISDPLDVPFFPRLKSVILYDCERFKEMGKSTRLFLERHSSTLEEITFMWYRLDLDSWREMLTGLPGIKSLAFQCRITFLPGLLSLLHELFPNLQSLSFTLDSQFFIPLDFTAAVTHESFPGLKSLTIAFDDETPSVAWKRTVISCMTHVTEDLMVHGNLARSTVFFKNYRTYSGASQEKEFKTIMVTHLLSLPHDIGVYGIDNMDRLVTNLPKQSQSSFREIGFRHRKRWSTMLLE